MITASRYHDICTGHRVHNHESKCAHLHGHNYRIHFTIAAPELDDVGRVLDFSVIKSALCEWLESEWDHKFLVWERDPMADTLHDLDPLGVVQVPFNPTAENMAAFLLHHIGPRQLEFTGAKLIEVRIEETAKCSAAAHLGE
jgi:6-pyruvoyltetrahydropterin/6-carboxytetrahydropterin synthase